ncbi:MAG: L,D-transpeptidase family protein [Bacteroidetes bacterium]|nr:L,D-transpeptidase family protein [Bacteroidota bacterium]
MSNRLILIMFYDTKPIGDDVKRIMNFFAAIFSILLFISSTVAAQDLLVDEQLQYPRVRAAKEAYNESLQRLFEAKGVAFPPKDIYLRTFKFDKEMELWALNGNTYTLIKTYEICQVSGELGPKRKQGDYQIPEGVYQLEHFNPTSNYYLSLKVNYPNESDRILGNQNSLGGDIFIHGDCVTVGCIPLENEPIKELYWLSVLTKQQGGNIPIHIFPFRMDATSLKFFEAIPLFDAEDWQFWKQLVPIYTYFEKYRKVPNVEVNDRGSYVLTGMNNWAKN